MLRRIWGKGKTHPLLVAVQTCTLTLKISVVSPQEVVNIFILRSSYSLGHIPKICFILLQRVFIHVHRCYIHNSVKLETAWMSINR